MGQVIVLNKMSVLLSGICTSQEISGQAMVLCLLTVLNHSILFVCVTDSPGLLSHVPVGIKVLDVNDNPPELAEDDDVVVCENAKPGQVTY